MNSEKIFINLKNYPLKQNNNYSFIYNNNIYYGKFIEKKNKLTIPPQTLFIFKEFTIKNHIYQPLNISYLIENISFSDSDSENDNNSENDNDSENDNHSNNKNINEINIENEIINNENIEIEYDLISENFVDDIDNEYVIL
jgi:hypothetical protein